MKFVTEPSIAVKIARMKQRVRWQESAIKERAIDQTQLVVDDPQSNSQDFSFLVIGDSGCGEHHGHSPQRKVAQMMLEHGHEADFVIHTGDVVYQVGSKEFYYQNFIAPYQELLVGGESPEQIAYDRMVFKLPIFPVPGNHDYYDLPLVYGILAKTTKPLRRVFGSYLDIDVGWHGSYEGQAYAKAFLDYLLDLEASHKLGEHLDRHYTAKFQDRRCLSYQPGKFTRLPNRYYSFRYGGIDFIALDSNTFDEPPPIPDTKEGRKIRRQLEARREKLETQKQKIWQSVAQLRRDSSEEDAERLDDYQGKLNQIEEMQRDIEKRLRKEKIATDHEQLSWLRDKLIASWQDETVRGRVIYLHHPPYVTEATKWNQGQTLEIRHHLRQVLDEVSQQLGKTPSERPLVDLVLSGHAHCLEHLYTEDTGRADSYVNWIVCGGSGHSLRRQRPQGAILQETREGKKLQVAQSLLFVGRNGHGSNKKKPYTCLQIKVGRGNPPKFIVQPLVVERSRHKWHKYQLDSFTV
ncbi:metallophosphoesterase [Myxosarcina sp. GI1]|uniref:metallophosphoesterase family protein n=1 Tax=Myxosarcina sp. GI1 TaxID=1541065 RepID=UPI00056423A1|nr:metallophosphoesterase [Myxosarcina sp. GI1]